MIEYSSGTVDAASLSDRVAELAAQLVDSSTSCLALYADNGIDWAISVAPDQRIPVLHEELRRRERLAFLGELAATVAHEVNNPLDGIQNCARILRRSFDDPERTKQMLDLIDNGLRWHVRAFDRKSQEFRDFVNLDSGERGQVVKIGLRSTRLLTRDDVEVTIPNATIATSKIVNESGGPWEKERVRVKVGVAYGSDIDRAQAVLLDVAQLNPDVCRTPKPRL